MNRTFKLIPQTIDCTCIHHQITCSLQRVWFLTMDFVCVADFEKQAQKVLDKNYFQFYRDGAGEQFTSNLNTDAYKRLRIRPRFLRNVSKLDTSSTILGQKLEWPLGISPTAMQRMAHPDGEVANARAAGEAGSVFILSTFSTTSIEELAEKAPNTIKWLQVFIYKDRSLLESLVRRAEKADFKAFVLTIDAPLPGQRRIEFRVPSHLQLPNFKDDGIDAKKSGITEHSLNELDMTVTWKDINCLLNLTKLPVIAKGVLTKEDAVLAREFGCQGIIVSNHGGRQLDYTPATIEVLPEIVKAVGNDLTVMIDGGIKTGNDIFKALALGAKMVFIGRPALWGLACGGQKGVKKMLDILRKDLEMVMILSGCATLNQIHSNFVAHESCYAKL